MIIFSRSPTLPEDFTNLVRYLWVAVARDGLTVDHIQCIFCGVVTFIFHESALIGDIHTIYVSQKFVCIW